MSSVESQSDSERITPVQLKPPGVAPTATPEVAHQQYLWVAIAAVALLFALVVIWLPSQLNDRPIPTATATDSARSSSDSRPVKTAPQAKAAQAETGNAKLDTETELANRQAAQRIADALQLRRAELEKLAVERWAAADYQQVGVNADRAADYFEKREYDNATTYWQKALDKANTLLGQVDVVLKSTVVKGYKALEDLDGDAAVAAFDLALAIHPENPLALVGMRRAKNLPQILNLLAAAENHEREDDLDQAMMLYQEVLKLDPTSMAAKEGIVRVGQGMLDWEFRIILSTAQQALSEGRYQAAIAEFNKAEKLKSGDSAVVEGRAEAERALLQQRVAALKLKAQQAESNEDWSTAVTHYSEIVKLDSTLSFAQSGLSRSRERAALDSELQTFIKDPDRLFSKKVMAHASEVLMQAEQVANPGERLQGQIDWMHKAIAMATKEVAVTLKSDNQTFVMVYHVGRLGQFERQELQLTPGDYVVVGRREGYRDLRTTISVTPGAKHIGPIDLRCTEKL